MLKNVYIYTFNISLLFISLLDLFVFRLSSAFFLSTDWVVHFASSQSEVPLMPVFLSLADT